MIFARLTYQIIGAVIFFYCLSAWWNWALWLGHFMNAALMVALLLDYQITQRPHLLTAVREAQDRLSIGRSNTVTIRVNNAGHTNLECRLKDDVPNGLFAEEEQFAFSLPASGFSILTYTVFPRRRGSYVFGPIYLRYLSFFRLFWRQTKLGSEKTIKVFSDLKALQDLTIKLSRSTELGELHQRKRGQGTDFSSLREYTIGDDAKAIDWKATARRERPIVRTYETEQEQRMLVLLDAGRMMTSDLEGLTRYDRALNAALCLALTGLTRNDQVGFGIFADRALAYLPPHRGKAYMKKILEMTSEIEPRMVEPDYVGMLSHFAAMQKGRCLMVVLTDLTDPVGSQALLNGLAALSPRHLPFCVTLSDRQVIALAHPKSSDTPQTEDVKNGHPRSRERDENEDEIMDRIFKRAIASDLLVQREMALNVLQRRGCLILDCPPQELSDKIVQSYIEIKTRAQI